jgi:hypothetical protein
VGPAEHLGARSDTVTRVCVAALGTQKVDFWAAATWSQSWASCLPCASVAV